jgi:hypothetical protein
MTAKRKLKNAVAPIGDRPPALPEAARKRGRKRISESRATEIRTRLVEWKQTPEASRSSLRALAAEIGTSHQLLSFYLRRWDKWQAKEYQRNANEIRARAEAEKRSMTEDEQAQVVAYTRAALVREIEAGVRDMLRRIRSKRGEMSRQELRFVRLLARKGYAEAKEMLGQSDRVSVQIVSNPNMLKISKIICHTTQSAFVSPLDKKVGGWQLR